MSLRNAAKVLVKDLRLGPRSPIFLYAIILPFAMSFLISAVFGSLFDPQPRLGIVDEGSSRVVAAAAELGGIDVTMIDDAVTLRSQVESHDLDAGLLLPAGFDAALQAGERPDLRFYVSGDSLASNRIVLAVTTTELLRGAAGQPDPVIVEVVAVGDQDYVPLGDRLLPMVVFYAVVIAGLFLPASSLLDERQSHTLDAMLVTPMRMSDVLLGKAALGVVLSVLLGMVTLAINNAFGGRPIAMLAFLLVGAVMMCELGLILGSVVKDANSLYTAIKGGGIFIFLPVIFVIWPGLPQWVPKLVPTYYFLRPIYDLAVLGSSFGDVAVEFAVASAICAALVPVVMAFGRRAEQRVAISV